ncbi:MAG: universal stress protein [Steroidobacteraceae bacterium]|jgi:universal stress protein E|nr:universal stress protein [Steroidobacteraceae bacterium]
MLEGFHQILFAVRDVDAVPAAALRKLAVLARACGARLELYHALTETITVARPSRRDVGAGPESVFDAVAARARARMEGLARATALRGLQVTVHVDWDYPAHEAVIRRARAISADLVVGEARQHPRLARPFLQNTDWELVRHCPVPLLLLKDRRRYRRPLVLAAVDPFHAADKPASLDRTLLAAGRRLATALDGTLHVMHAWQPLASLVPTAASSPVPAYLPPEVEAAHARQVRKAFERVASRAGVETAARHLVAGPVPAALEAVTRRTRAAILVMGAVSRRGLQRLFIGNTAERVLGQVSCDVLVVKGPGFRSRVPARSAARRPVIAPLPY